MSVSDEAAALPFRLRVLEKTADEYRSWRRKVDTEQATQAQSINSLDKKMDSVIESNDSLRKVLLAFAFTIAGSAVVFGLSVLIATGKI